jgi:hypothetical protein
MTDERDRPTDEIQLTDEMTEAGARAYRRRDSCVMSDEDVVI